MYVFSFPVPSETGLWKAVTTCTPDLLGEFFLFLGVGEMVWVLVGPEMSACANK